MNHTHPESISPISPSEKKVIGFLTESLNSHYQSSIWMGASDYANKLGYTLICFAGGSLKESPWNRFEPQRNIIYNFINKKLLTGIIISGSLGNFIPPEEFREFYHQFIDMPLVCLGPEITSIPTVIADNYNGMFELISHLIEIHECKKMAFVRGPVGNKEAEERLRIFTEVLTAHDITPDPELIIPGDFSHDAGVKAAKYLLEKNYKVDALVAANDDTALGALKTFQENHIRVPEEIRIVGFDDIEESKFSAPPLTTVKQPLAEMGAKAVEIIHQRINGGKVKAKIIVPARVVLRQSCGCLRYSRKVNIISEEEFLLGKEATKKISPEKIEEAFNTILERKIPELEITYIREIVRAFIEEIFYSKKTIFILTVSRIAWTISLAGGDVTRLYSLLSLMRKLCVTLEGTLSKDEIDLVLENAFIAISEATTRAHTNRRLESERKSTILRAAGLSIASAFDLEHLLDVITTELLNLDIDGCYLSLYEQISPEANTPITLRVVLSLHNGKRIPLATERGVFNSPELTPAGMIDFAQPQSLLVEPLFFREQQIGIIIFEVKKCREGQIYEILQQHISSALKGALLMKQVQEQATALELANRELRKLRDAEHAYLQAIKHELELGREIQSSFLPRTIPNLAGWEIVTAFQPAREVSGDFYDIFTLSDNKLVIVICDVSGKDVSAALFMALIRTLIRALAEELLGGVSQPLDAVVMTNKYLINHHYGNNGRYMYATLFMGVLDPETGIMNYINAGHNPAALISKSGEIKKWIGNTGPAVGIVPEAEFIKEAIEILPEDILFLYTDGVTEARNPEGVLFSKKRLATLLSQPSPTATSLIKSIELAVKEHTAGNPPFDDITMMAIKRLER